MALFLTVAFIVVFLGGFVGGLIAAREIADLDLALPLIDDLEDRRDFAGALVATIAQSSDVRLSRQTIYRIAQSSIQVFEERLARSLA